MAMMVTNREKALVAIVAILLLYAGVLASLRSRIDRMRDLRAARDRAGRELADKRALVASEGAWREAYGKRSEMIPVFGRDELVVTHWVRTLTRLAETNGVTIVKPKIGQEREAGGIFELEISFDCEGSLEAFVPFLHGVYSEGAMLDIRRLTLKPQQDKGAGGLKANATLYCAYMRDDGGRQ